ncbi:MAG: thioredoxin family protein [Bacilli bacterium]
MKNKKLIYYIIFGIIVLLVILFFGYKLFFEKDKFISLSYEEVINKVNNNESFVLCVSATDCIHCQDYKPKLKTIANKYNTQIFYTDVDTFSEEDYEKFKTEFSFDGSTPTTIFFNDGEEKTTATRIEGDVSTEKIINKLKKNGFIK